MPSKSSGDRDARNFASSIGYLSCSRHSLKLRHKYIEPPNFWPFLQPDAASTLPSTSFQNRKLMELPMVKYWERLAGVSSTFQKSGSSHFDRSNSEKSVRFLMWWARFERTCSSIWTNLLSEQSIPRSRASSGV